MRSSQGVARLVRSIAQRDSFFRPGRPVIGQGVGKDGWQEEDRIFLRNFVCEAELRCLLSVKEAPVRFEALRTRASSSSQGRHPPFFSVSYQRATARFLFTQISKEHAALQTLSGSDAGIAVLVLNRPEARNAVGDEMLHELKSITENLRFDSSARVLIICSAVPGVFCAGADLKERRAKTPAEVQKYGTTLRSTFTAIEAVHLWFPEPYLLVGWQTLPIPSIAVIEGAALGGGLELALSCDLRICGRDAVLGLPETSHAIIPGAGGTQRLPRLIGRALAKELIFTARRVDGSYGEKIGIVNHCVDAGRAFEKAVEIAREILQKGPIAVRMAKIAIDRGAEVETSSGLAIEEACYAQTLHTKDRLEGLAAFAEKRRPSYKGE